MTWPSAGPTRTSARRGIGCELTSTSDSASRAPASAAAGRPVAGEPACPRHFGGSQSAGPARAARLGRLSAATEHRAREGLLSTARRVGESVPSARRNRRIGCSRKQRRRIVAAGSRLGGRECRSLGTAARLCGEWLPDSHQGSPYGKYFYQNVPNIAPLWLLPQKCRRHGLVYAAVQGA